LHGEGRYKELHQSNIDSTEDKTRDIHRAGFREKATSEGSDVWDYFVLPQVFRSDLCKGFEQKTVTKVLKEKGILQPGTDGKMSKLKRLPGMGNTRCYVISGKALFEENSVIIPQAERAGTPQPEQGVPPSEGNECNKNEVLPVAEHQKHREHPKIAVTNKSSENELISDAAEPTHPTARVKPGANKEAQQNSRQQGSTEAQQQTRSSVKTKRLPTVQANLDFGPGVDTSTRTGTTANYGPV
jgi:hypothetical protein